MLRWDVILLLAATLCSGASCDQGGDRREYGAANDLGGQRNSERLALGSDASASRKTPRPTSDLERKARAHWQAIGDADLDALMRDYGSSPTLEWVGGPLNGHYAGSDLQRHGRLLQVERCCRLREAQPLRNCAEDLQSPVLHMLFLVTTKR